MSQLVATVFRNQKTETCLVLVGVITIMLLLVMGYLNVCLKLVFYCYGTFLPFLYILKLPIDI